MKTNSNIYVFSTHSYGFASLLMCAIAYGKIAWGQTRNSEREKEKRARLLANLLSSESFCLLSRLFFYQKHFLNAFAVIISSWHFFALFIYWDRIAFHHSHETIEEISVVSACKLHWPNIHFPHDIFHLIFTIPLDRADIYCCGRTKTFQNHSTWSMHSFCSIFLMWKILEM